MPNSERGIIHLLPLILVAVVIVFIGYVLISKGVVQNPVPQIIKTSTTEVELQADYKNPLSKDSQYVNPFSEYKNPFDELK